MLKLTGNDIRPECNDYGGRKRTRGLPIQNMNIRITKWHMLTLLPILFSTPVLSFIFKEEELVFNASMECGQKQHDGIFV
jgi:hypothetical protein